ncbi:hypothetical protein GWE18_00425 [Bradyrhizobium sp. CSA112]|uniref:hypothetical protein n=1 Tax=Bradyrhizobium sp. CSA112 TaxID=2699170 RepID=UPI0023AF7A2F|nr:hypothetical protein [Bradyrhizobium sp. CSA112]MDE5451341.1 hypothetical protein [Bradyrhizobium sp. CSA112]
MPRLSDVPVYLFLSALLLSPTLYPFLLSEKQTDDPTRLEPSGPMRYEKVEFSKAKLAAMIPAIKLTACLFAEKAVRHHVRPTPVMLPSCGGKDFRVDISDDLINIAVSGIATIDKVDRPFTVTLLHNPVSVTEDGLIVTEILVR